MAEYRKPLPLPDLDSQAFWDSCRSHAMALQQCTTCKHFRYPPRPLCPHCHNPEGELKPVSGKGRVYVTLVMCRSPGSAWEQDVPYNVSMIELDEGVRIWSNVIGCPPENVTIGDRVTIAYEDVADSFSLPKFQTLA